MPWKESIALDVQGDIHFFIRLVCCRIVKEICRRMHIQCIPIHPVFKENKSDHKSFMN